MATKQTMSDIDRCHGCVLVEIETPQGPVMAGGQGVHLAGCDGTQRGASTTRRSQYNRRLAAMLQQVLG